MFRENFVTKIQFARFAKVTPAAITKALKHGLDEAMTGKRINMAHPVAADYLRSKIGYKNVAAMLGTIQTVGGDNTQSPTPQPAQVEPVLTKPNKRGYAAKSDQAKRSATDEDQILEIPENIQAFADMTLRELVEKFGTDLRFVDWLRATKSIEDINEKRLKNAQTKGELVSRKLIKIGVIDPINAAHIKLLTDGAKTIARRATAMNSAGRPLKDVEKFVIDQITSFIRPVKSKVARALRDA